MRTAAALLVLACTLGGCGEGKRAAARTTTAATTTTRAAEGLHIGVVGPLSVHVPGAVIEHGTLAQVAGDPLVVLAAGGRAAQRVRAVAAADQVGHYAVVGASEKSPPLPNLAGLVFREDEAARLGGVVAGLVVAEESSAAPRVAWVGPQERPLAAAFVRGVHDIVPGAVVLRAWSADRPAACKEAALGALARGATVVMAHGGLCASAAIAGSRQQNHPGLRLSDFLVPDVPATQVARDAVEGVYHGGEDLVFGAASGAVGIRRLDPRISPTTAVRARAAAQELASGRPPSG
jgi:hypothetical protein